MEKTHTVQDCERIFSPVPHLAPGAISFLRDYLKKDMNVFEWGAGGSTIWISERVKHIFSVEAKIHWIQFIADTARKEGLNNITLHYQAAKDVMSAAKYMIGPDNYYTYIEQLKMKFEIILIDGETNSRNECLKRAIPHLAESGFIIFDNFASFRFDKAREFIRHWSIINYPREDGNTTAVISRFPYGKREVL